MSLDPPKVLLEESFLTAVADPSDPRHADGVALYRRLLDDTEAGRVLLVAVDEHLRRHLAPLPTDPVERAVATVRRLLRPTGLFAPVHPLHVSGQHRRAARRSTVDAYDHALTLVMCDRHRIRRLATFDPTFESVHLHLEAVGAAATGGESAPT